MRPVPCEDRAREGRPLLGPLCVAPGVERHVREGSRLFTTALSRRPVPSVRFVNLALGIDKTGEAGESADVSGTCRFPDPVRHNGYGNTVVTDEADLKPVIERLLSEPGAAAVHVRSLAPQCSLYAVTAA
jgi:hypothetical protein